MTGLSGSVERKNGPQLAEELGDDTPTTLQHLIARSPPDADAVRDDLRGYVCEHLGTRGGVLPVAAFCPDGVLIVDETGFLKKGTKRVGVKRQYSGTAGRTENCQIGVLLAYKSEHGHALLDRRLPLPAEWVDDTERRSGAKVPAEAAFATKPTLARTMIGQALPAGVPTRWVTADAVPGGDSTFRGLREDRGLVSVLAVTSHQRLWQDGRQVRVDAGPGRGLGQSERGVKKKETGTDTGTGTNTDMNTAAAIPWTVPDGRRLVCRQITRHRPDRAAVLGWSNWRSQHQHQALLCPFKRRGHAPPMLNMQLPY